MTDLRNHRRESRTVPGRPVAVCFANMAGSPPYDRRSGTVSPKWLAVRGASVAHLGRVA